MKRYVIGDIHGCCDELIGLLGKIVEHANGPHKIIFVGDYVDRGPDSKEVVNLVMGLEKQGHVALMGNHEDMLLAGEYTYAAETIVSFGGFPGHFIPEYALEWMRSLPKYYEDDTIIVAHADANPVFPMDEQTDAMLMWLRYKPGQPAQLNKHFYHGHTPFTTKTPEGAVDRTNVDTGCVYGGFLTAAIVGENGKPEGFLQVPAKKSVIDV